MAGKRNGYKSRQINKKRKDSCLEGNYGTKTDKERWGYRNRNGGRVRLPY